jgi:hypothetical protein
MRALVLAGALALAGCGQSGDTVSNIPEEAESVPAATLDAGEAVEALKAAGLPVAGINVLTEATDANKMMGRPGGYTSKAFFFDQRHEGEGNEPAEQNTIEVFASEAEATKRREYIESVTEGMPFLMQYMIQSGPMLLRLDKALTPTEAKEYEAALGQL